MSEAIKNNSGKAAVSHSRMRLVAILIIGIVFPAIIVFNIWQRMQADIETLKLDIRNRQSEIEALTPIAARTDDLTRKISEFNNRIFQVEKLEASRVRSNRMLTRLGNAVCPIDDVYLRNLAIIPAIAGPADGKHFQISITGKILGPPEQRNAKLTALIDALEKQFEVPAADPALLKRDNAKGKMSAFLNARFERPVLSAEGATTDPKGTEILLIMRFELPSVDDEWHRTQRDDSVFKFDPPLSQRDPFGVPKK